MLLCSLSVCLSIVAARPAPIHDEAAVARTRHYELHASTTQEECDELSVVLEAAWKHYKSFLKKEPRSRERFLVRVLPDKDSWLERIRAEGGEPPTWLDLLWYRPETETIYTYRQASRAATRSLVLFGAWQQFHCRTKSKHIDLINHWYIRGLGEHFATHRWDGKRLEVGVRPNISSSDLMGHALTTLEEAGTLEEGVTLDQLQAPAVQYAMVRFLMEGENRKHRKRFQKLALGSQGSKLTGDEYLQAIGDRDELAHAFYRWLRGAQLPWVVVDGAWDELPGGDFLATPPYGRYSVAHLRGRANRLAMRVEVGEDGSNPAGLILAFQDPMSFTLARVVDLEVRVERFVEGQARVLASYLPPASDSTSWTLEARRDGELAVLVVDGERAGSWDVPGSLLGLATEETATFEELVWD